MYILQRVRYFKPSLMLQPQSHVINLSKKILNDVVVQSFSHVWLLVTHGLQHTRLPSPALFPGVGSNSCSLPRRQWHPTPVLLPGKSHGTAEPGRLQSMGLLRVGHDWATSLSLFTSMHWRRKWQPTPVFLLGESQGRGSLVVYGVTQSQTRLKRLSSSSSMFIESMIPFNHLILCRPNLLLSSIFPSVRFFSLFPNSKKYGVSKANITSWIMIIIMIVTVMIMIAEISWALFIRKTFTYLTCP